MDNANLQSIILTEGCADTLYGKLHGLLSIVRRHLDMDVAFVSEFVDAQRVFRFVDAASRQPPLEVGGSDPLEETYCKRIADRKLENIIRDTSGNPITKSLSVTEKLAIGAYIGVPITLSTGAVYGTFCCYKGAADETLNNRDLAFLSAISEIAGELIESNIDAENEQREMLERVRSVLDDAKVDIHYQPIFNLHTNEVAGFESLARFASNPYRTPDVWFDEASQVGLGEELEVVAIRNAVRGLNHFRDDAYISINASPEHVVSGAVAKAIAGVDSRRIVLEVTEHSPVNNYSELARAIEVLRERGMRLAIDDAGAGYASFQHVLELNADIIKLDISLTKNIHAEPRKYSLAKALCAFAKSVGCSIIAEGIETEEDLQVLRKLGVDKVQGYLLGRPVPLQEAVSAQHQCI